MKRSILITGVGAIMGQGIIKSLRDAKLSLRLVGIDANPHSVGFAWVDASHTVPRVDDPQWLSSLTRICNKEDVALILPGIEQDVKALRAHEEEFAKGSKALPLLNSPEALKVGFDKWELYLFARSNGVKTPRTWCGTKIDRMKLGALDYPVILKPRSKFGSKGVVKVATKEEMAHWLGLIDGEGYVVQKYIGDVAEEYTVSIFGFHDGRLSDPFALRRRLCYGSTFEAETVNDETLSQQVVQLAQKLNIVGPTNFQFRKEKDDYYLLEVNPRFTSSVSIRSAFGFNEPWMAVESFLFHKVPAKPKFKQGRCSRYIADHIVLA